MKGFWDGSGISWTICKQFAPRSRQITTSTPHQSTVTGRTLFLTPNQQCQSTDGQNLHSDWLILLGLIKDKMRSLPQHTAQYLAIQSAAGSRAAGETAAADCLAVHTEGSVTQQPRQPATVSLLSNATHTSLSSRVVSASDSGVRGSRFESRR